VIRRSAALALAMALATLVGSGLTLGFASASADAASPVVLVSTDGVNYQPSLAVDLFSDVGLLVPGDSATSELWIKNPLTTSATVRVNVGSVTSSSVELADNMQLSAVDTSNGGRVAATWSELATCDVMVKPVTIPGGAVLQIDLSLVMLNAPALVAQHQNGSLTADVQMRDAAAGSFPVSSCDPGSSDPRTFSPGAIDPGTTDPGTTTPGTTQPAATQPRKVLGYTGETFPTQLLMLGGILVGVGWFLVVARRRRKREEAQE
jgi:LPXTG-motif cell wall-anchored protein